MRNRLEDFSRQTSVTEFHLHERLIRAFCHCHNLLYSARANWRLQFLLQRFYIHSHLVRLHIGLSLLSTTTGSQLAPSSLAGNRATLARLSIPIYARFESQWSSIFSRCLEHQCKRRNFQSSWKGSVQQLQQCYERRNGGTSILPVN
jgi:hypothetical protein